MPQFLISYVTYAVNISKHMVAYRAYCTYLLSRISSPVFNALMLMQVCNAATFPSRHGHHNWHKKQQIDR